MAFNMTQILDKLISTPVASNDPRTHCPISGDVHTDIKCLVLKQWWERHCQSFSLWFLQLSPEDQRKVLLTACPDMPDNLVSANSAVVQAAIEGEEGAHSTIAATCAILPELLLDSLLSCDGKLLVLFATRRCTAADCCYSSDFMIMNNLFYKGKLPSFSSNQFKDLDTPFIDPQDITESIQALQPGVTSDRVREEVMNQLQVGKLVYADVWLALKIRRLAITNFLVSLTESHQSMCKEKPSPTYKALLEGELLQRATLNV